MTTVLQIGNRTITTEEIIPLLASYQMFPQLLRESIIDSAIASFNCTPEEIAHACGNFYQQNQLTSEAEQQAWLERYGMSQEHLEALTTRKLRIEKFKQATWGNKLESYFLKRKGQLDQAIYSLIRTKDPGIAQELYFRLSEQEQSFSELAAEYSQGPEAQTGGTIGPVEIGTLHPHLARLLSVSQKNQLWSPRPLGEWMVIVRLEKLVPAQLNEFMRQRLLRELFETWVQEQIGKLPEADKIWLGAATNRKVEASGQLAAA
jgi:parvulin-like peptidyl-prolyl isomerase